eukprot:scaffold380749_cov32-Prasinocladus_malaysianus.AAC.1
MSFCEDFDGQGLGSDFDDDQLVVAAADPVNQMQQQPANQAPAPAPTPIKQAASAAGESAPRSPSWSIRTGVWAALAARSLSHEAREAVVK